MSTPVFKNGVAIDVVYQAAGAGTGETIAMDVYDEAGVLDVAKSVAAMTEILATGRYTATFTPDAVGSWVVQMYDSVNNTGKVVKQYAVGATDLDTVGATGDAVKLQTDLLPADPASQASVDASITASETTINANIDDLESPAMVG